MNKSMFSNPTPHQNSHYITTHNKLKHTPFPTPAIPCWSSVGGHSFCLIFPQVLWRCLQSYGNAPKCLLRYMDRPQRHGATWGREKCLGLASWQGWAACAFTGHQHHRLMAQAPCRSERKLRCSLQRTWPPGRQNSTRNHCRHLDMVAFLLNAHTSLSKDCSVL